MRPPRKTESEYGSVADATAISFTTGASAGVVLSILYILVSLVANAQMGNVVVAHKAPGGGSSYTGPGDIQAFTHWYGLRAYSNAVAAAGTHALINVIRSSDSHTCDILVATAGGFGNTSGCSTGGDNGQTAASFCNATTCKAKTLYDQVSTFNLIQNTGANQPTLVFNCVNTSLPCLQAGGSTITMVSGSNFTPTTGVQTLSGVANRSSGTGLGTIIEENASANRMAMVNGSANQWFISGSSNLVVTASDATWHAGNGVINGASPNTIFNIDGTESTGSGGSNTTAGTTQAIIGSASTTSQWAEAGYVDNTAVALSIRSKLCDNQHGYYATTAGTHCNSGGT